jgi:thiol-disulfide isomerase/thioredoxin
MKKTLTVFSLMVFLVACASPLFAGTDPPEMGGVLPQITLSVPENPGQQSYLGVTGKETFTIPEIKAEVVIVEIYSMYCPFCQAEAPLINELYTKIQRNGNLKDKIKLIGIAAGNSEFEVDVYRKKYNVAFPLFSDGDFVIHKSIGEVRTPYFIGIKNNKDGTHTVVYSKLGTIKNADKFIDLITQDAGL